MSTSGHLKFQGTNRATFVGTTSNIMFDTTSTSLGIGVTGTDHPSSNLYITGNAYVSSNIAVGGVLTMGTVNVVARHDLEAVTATGNITPLTLEFTNPTTSIVASGNVEVLKDLTVSGNVAVDTNTFFVDSVNNRVGIGTGNPKTDGLNVVGSFVGQGVESTIFSHNLYYNSGWKYASANNGGAYMRVVDSEIQFWNAPNSGAEDAAASVSQRMTIDVDGNVGIGRTTPSQQLHVNGNAQINNCAIKSSGGNGTSGIDTGINMNGGTGGGMVMIMITNQNNGGSNTGMFCYLLRKHHDSATSKTQSELSTHLVVNAPGGTTAGTVVTFYTDPSSILKFDFNGARNYKWAAIEL